MRLPSFSLNPFPNWKKPTPTELTTAAGDDLEPVKAAAWAWYQHGSGSESKPMRELGLTRPITLSKPSRYRLEASRIAQAFSPDISQTPNLQNSLLDCYEVASISRRLSNLLDPTDRNNFSLQSLESGILDLGREIERKSAKPKKFGSFWRWPTVMCRKMEDVVLRSLVRTPEKPPQRPTRRRSTALFDGL